MTASFGGDMAIAMVSVTEPFSGGLIISEYIEGSGNNKVIELYNGSDAIDLAANNCELRLTTNATGSNRTLELTGTIAMGETLVICNPSADVPDAVCDIRDSAINHNGNDPYALECDGMVIDSFGQLGTDPGDAWAANGVSSQNQTLRRKCDVVGADTEESDAFDPSVDYDTFPINTFDGLGSHCL